MIASRAELNTSPGGRIANEQSGAPCPTALARLGRRGGSERRRDVDDGRSLALQTHERQRPHVLRRPEPLSRIGRDNRPAGVGDDEHMIAEVGGMPRGGSS